MDALLNRQVSNDFYNHNLVFFLSLVSMLKPVSSTPLDRAPANLIILMRYDDETLQ